MIKLLSPYQLNEFDSLAQNILFFICGQNQIIAASRFNSLFVKDDCTLLESLTFNPVLRVYVFISTFFRQIFFIVVLSMKSNYGGSIYFSHLLISMEVYCFHFIIGFKSTFVIPLTCSFVDEQSHSDTYMFKLKYFVGTSLQNCFVLVDPLSTKFCTYVCENSFWEVLLNSTFD